jgi:hypothetical protein
VELFRLVCTWEGCATITCQSTSHIIPLLPPPPLTVAAARKLPPNARLDPNLSPPTFATSHKST